MRESFWWLHPHSIAARRGMSSNVFTQKSCWTCSHGQPMSNPVGQHGRVNSGINGRDLASKYFIIASGWVSFSGGYLFARIVLNPVPLRVVSHKALVRRLVEPKPRIFSPGTARAHIGRGSV